MSKGHKFGTIYGCLLISGPFLLTVVGCITTATTARSAGTGFEEFRLEERFNNNVEISGLDISRDTLYLLSEGCHEVYAFALDQLKGNATNAPVRTYRLPAMADDDLEALAIAGDLVFYTNEKINSIYAARLHPSPQPVPVIHSASLPVQQDDGEAGLEGMAIDPRRKFLYVLQERDRKEGTRSAQLMMFTFRERRDSVYLDLRDTMSITIPSPYRYTSLGLSPDGKLYTTRTCYGKVGCDTGEYYIERVRLSSSGYFAVPRSSPDDQFPLTLDAKAMNYPNLEGIAVGDDNVAYLVNDNADIKGDTSLCTTPSNRKTRLFRVSLQ
ncbi:esterase-like activity of phytase family protein [Lewinella sp. IMCC34183]|uniref:esterase-like activity of phytase family protein n=1 Tax=Lewinella sp. IMCC34183 TaxID=2248762 RepID=UPI000E27339E|nr:esterase-like activity of phytase family protein [Lewinella sp. IMCC34183]